MVRLFLAITANSFLLAAFQPFISRKGAKAQRTMRECFYFSFSLRLSFAPLREAILSVNQLGWRFIEMKFAGRHDVGGEVAVGFEQTGELAGEFTQAAIA